MEKVTEDWKRFFILQAGRTNGAHQSIVEMLQSFGHSKVMSPEDGDYLVVFCPIVSRVGTDIAEAQNCIPSAKPVILVVMHHTFNENSVVGESRRQVTHPNVRLMVDCLFYQDKLLKCRLNNIMREEIQKFLRVLTRSLVLVMSAVLEMFLCLSIKKTKRTKE
ncbi:uncharacterized protein KZ484_013099 [Pholidichthys leucotaenia]